QAPLLGALPKGLQMLAQRQAGNVEDLAGEGLPRRAFLKLAAGSGFALGAFPLVASAQNAAGAAGGLKPTQQPAALVRIERDGTVTVTVNRLEFGQGAHTGLAMVLAEELDADWAQVRAVPGDADPAYVDPGFGIHITGG
ncbi:molybdopterin cofactor-binding domain-containing protein, partial [Leptospira sp. SA-E8]|uniref:molybdopterin cofactor-binding domain-containing protein n=1 Tax=Leptospira sp. SA-E8 TaxID=3422259 RepID=UPI003EBE7761